MNESEKNENASFISGLNETDAGTCVLGPEYLKSVVERAGKAYPCTAEDAEPVIEVE